MMRGAVTMPDRVAAALGLSSMSLEPLGASVWSVGLQNGKHLSAVAVLGGSWLSLTTATPGIAGPANAWRLLELNGQMEYGARFTIARRDLRAQLRAETYLEPEGDPNAAVAGVCATLLRAASHVAEGSPIAEAPCSGLPASPAQHPLRDTLAESSWSWVAHDDGSWTLEFETARDRCQAVLREDATGLRCQVVLGEGRPATAHERSALGTMLLLATDAMHLVRGTLTDRTGIALEIALPHPIRAADVGVATESLMGACAQIGRETRAFRDPMLVNEYLHICTRPRGNGRAASAPQTDPARPLAPTHGG